jgi:hypothetical protein
LQSKIYAEVKEVSDITQEIDTCENVSEFVTLWNTLKPNDDICMPKDLPIQTLFSDFVLRLCSADPVLSLTRRDVRCDVKNYGIFDVEIQINVDGDVENYATDCLFHGLLCNTRCIHRCSIDGPIICGPW